MSEERLQKILAAAGIASRRKAEDLIRAGRVTVNGTPAQLGDRADPQRDAVKVDGRRIRSERNLRYVLLNKPPGYVCTLSDPQGRPTVLELVATRLRKGLVPVGRLDYGSEGLLLLTNDGDLAQRVAHPRYGCSKTYEVKVKGRPQESALDRLRAGIRLQGQPTAPCRIRQRRVARRGSKSLNSWFTVELFEGRTRQIREMFSRIGHSVLKLRRVAIGPLSDRRLRSGAFRELSAEEVAMLRGSSGDSGPPGRARPRNPAP